LRGLRQYLFRFYVKIVYNGIAETVPSPKKRYAGTLIIRVRVASASVGAGAGAGAGTAVVVVVVVVVSSLSSICACRVVVLPGDRGSVGAVLALSGAAGVLCCRVARLSGVVVLMCCRAAGWRGCRFGGWRVASNGISGDALFPPLSGKVLPLFRKPFCSSVPAGLLRVQVLVLRLLGNPAAVLPCSRAAVLRGVRCPVSGVESARWIAGRVLLCSCAAV
jgi:hypothetical protein